MPQRWYSLAISSRDEAGLSPSWGGCQSERVQSRYPSRSDHLPPMARNPISRLAAPVGVHRLAYAGKLTCHPTSITRSATTAPRGRGRDGTAAALAPPEQPQPYWSPAPRH